MQIVMRITDLKGYCHIEHYKNWMVIHDLGFGFSENVSSEDVFSNSDSTEAEKARQQTKEKKPQSLSFSKSTDGSTPGLMHRAITDRSESTRTKDHAAEIHFLEAFEVLGGSQDRLKATWKTVAFFKIKLGKAIVSSWSLSASDSGHPTESCELIFGQVAVQYHGHATAVEDGKQWGNFQELASKSYDLGENQDWTKPGNWNVSNGVVTSAQ